MALVTVLFWGSRGVMSVREGTTLCGLVVPHRLGGELNGRVKRTNRQPDRSRVSPVMVEDTRNRSTDPTFGRRPPRRLTGVLVVAALAAVVGLVTVRPDGGGEREASGAPTRSFPPTTLDQAGVVSLDGPELVWSPVDLPAEGDLTVTFGDGGFLAAERIGGWEDMSAVRARVWQSDDGRQWRELAPAPFPAGTELGAVTAYDGVVVAAGATSQADGDVTPGVWYWTSESGWNKSPLPKPAGLGAGEAAFPTEVVAGPKGFVLRALGGAAVDPVELVAPALPSEVAAALDAGASLSSGSMGVEVYGPGGIVFFRAGFDELGVDRTVLSTVGQPSPGFLFWSSDGRTWEPVEDPYPGRWPDVVTATNNGFVAAGWVSNDGTTWTPPDPDPQMEPLQMIGRWGERFVAVSYSANRFLVSDDALQWDPFGPDPTSGLLSTTSWLGWLATGELGILALEVNYGPTSAVLQQPPTIEKDGLVVTIGADGPQIVVRDADSGAEVLNVLSKGERTQQQVRYDFDAQTMTLIDPETGHEVVSLTFGEISAAQNVAYPPEEPETHLLFTADGDTWSRQATNTQLDGYINSMAVGQNEAVAATISPTGTARLWIGTLNQ